MIELIPAVVMTTPDANESPAGIPSSRLGHRCRCCRLPVDTPSPSPHPSPSLAPPPHPPHHPRRSRRAYTHLELLATHQPFAGVEPTKLRFELQLTSLTGRTRRRGGRAARTRRERLTGAPDSPFAARPDLLRRRRRRRGRWSAEL